MAEWDVGLAVLSESCRVLERPDWIGDDKKRVAIVRGSHLPIRSLAQRDEFAVANWGGLVIVAIYAPPSLRRSSFERLLDKLS